MDISDPEKYDSAVDHLGDIIENGDHDILLFTGARATNSDIELDSVQLARRPLSSVKVRDSLIASTIIDSANEADISVHEQLHRVIKQIALQLLGEQKGDVVTMDVTSQAAEYLDFDPDEFGGNFEDEDDDDEW